MLDEYKDRIVKSLPCAASQLSAVKLSTHSKITNDVSSDVNQQYLWIIEKVTERLKQCSDVIDWNKSFSLKYQESLKCIECGEKVIAKYSSASTDMEMQLKKCSVSSWYMCTVYDS